MYLMNQKQSIDSGTCIIMLDFAENILAMSEKIRMFYKMKLSCFIGITANNAAFTQLLL